MGRPARCSHRWSSWISNGSRGPRCMGNADGAPGEIRSPDLPQLPDFSEAGNRIAAHCAVTSPSAPRDTQCAKSEVRQSNDQFRLRLRGRIWWADFTPETGNRLRFSTAETDRVLAATAARTELAKRTEQRQLTVGDLLRHLWDTRWSTSRAAIQLRYTVPLCASEVGHWAAAGVTYAALDGYARGCWRAT